MTKEDAKNEVRLSFENVIGESIIFCLNEFASILTSEEIKAEAISTLVDYFDCVIEEMKED